ncbi:hypothetical protein HPB47_014267, partial [Ixodes persulcatus]
MPNVKITFAEYVTKPLVESVTLCETAPPLREAFQLNAATPRPPRMSHGFVRPAKEDLVAARLLSKIKATDLPLRLPQHQRFEEEVGPGKHRTATNPEVKDVLQKGPKLSFEPSTRRQELLATERRVADCAGEQNKECAIDDDVDFLKDT